jgi:hypothetical protein
MLRLARTVTFAVSLALPSRVWVRIKVGKCREKSIIICHFYSVLSPGKWLQMIGNATESHPGYWPFRKNGKIFTIRCTFSRGNSKYTVTCRNNRIMSLVIRCCSDFRAPKITRYFSHCPTFWWLLCHTAITHSFIQTPFTLASTICLFPKMYKELDFLQRFAYFQFRRRTHTDYISNGFIFEMYTETQHVCAAPREIERHRVGAKESERKYSSFFSVWVSEMLH